MQDPKKPFAVGFSTSISPEYNSGLAQGIAFRPSLRIETTGLELLRFSLVNTR